MDGQPRNALSPYGSSTHQQQQQQQQPLSFAMSTDTLGMLPSVRPKDAAISCSHFWAIALMVAGIAGFIVGAILFSEWKGLGSFWVGITAIGTGVAGIYVARDVPAGGLATRFYLVLSIVTFAASVFSIMLGDGVAYLVVKETEGNCVEIDSCSTDSCGDYDCVCWKPDGSRECSEGSNLRYCLRYGGDRCSDIEESEEWLLGSSIMLVIIGFFSLCSLAVAISTCFSCKRIMVVDQRSSSLR